MSALLRCVAVDQVGAMISRGIDRATLDVAAGIVEDVRDRGELAVREHAVRLGDCELGAPLRFERHQLQRALDQLPTEQRQLLERTADRITRFAKAQRECLLPLDAIVPGGRAGHRWMPVGSVGAYAPGGRHPLPSSVLMTVLPARVAGVANIVVASPRPTPVTLAAAALAGADALIAVGGAQAIAALAFGSLSVPADIVAGPGNRWVTAAKKHLVGEVGIDGLAGPSELLVLADATADAATIAADLLGQAEHDEDAVPMLVTTDEALIARVEVELEQQLRTLPTAATARAALQGSGFAAVVESAGAMVALANRLAPEHLELFLADAGAWRSRLTAYGSLFVGGGSAEVFGDYGAGPNHVLPTGGGSRFQAGLSVATFLRPLTYLQIDDSRELAVDAARLARLEGLEGHARSAELRG